MHRRLNELQAVPSVFQGPVALESVVDSALLRPIFRPFRSFFLCTICAQNSRSKFFIDQLDWNELYPQLVLSQTPGLRLGVHERGTFTELRECQVDSDDGAGAGEPAGLPAQRRETAAQLVRLARVLEEVQELAISRGPGPAGSFSLVCEGGKLQVYGRKGVKRSCLPPDVRTRFTRAGVSDADE